ncbi:MAG: outer membrane protein assembly factor BamA [Pseudomonadota bacterium]
MSIAILLIPAALLAQSAQFARIEVTGNQRIEAETIQVFSGLEPGAPTTPAQINSAVQRLFETGLFEDVSITPDGGRLVIAFVENPTINEIAFEGNDAINNELLDGIISLSPRRPFNRSAAEADAQNIIELYARSGRFGARVEPKIIRLEDNRVNLVYEITEGRVTEVQRVAFVGNDVYSDRRLRRVIETRQAGILSAILRRDTYDPDRLELDRQRLREFYVNRGFVDFEVQSASAELSRERNAFFLTFRLSEGIRYRYGDVTVESNAPGLEPAAFERIVDLRAGRFYNAARVERVVERMAFFAGQSGFAFTEIVPRLSRNPEEGTVDIVFELIEGPRVFIERIDIRGNRDTVDRVIRRQFRVVEGDAFNARELREAENRIRALGFFSEVDVRVREGASRDRAVISVDLEEAPTGNLGFGAAFSSSEGITGTISLTERNFLGRGQRVSVDFAGGANVTTLAFSFLEPSLFDQDLSAGFSTFFRQINVDESSLETTSFGFIPEVGFPLTEDSRLRLRFRASFDDIALINEETTSPIIVAEAGQESTFSIGGTYVLDKRNSPVDPTAGFILRLDQEIAGIAGNSNFSKSEGSIRFFSSLLNEDVILSAELAGGALFSFDGDTRFTERFSLGGDLLRGFQFGGIGPRDKCTACNGPGDAFDVDDALGGNFFSVARFEASFPIGLPSNLGIFGGVFADIGSVWDLDDVDGASGEIDDSFNLRSSVGLSLFWDSAIGPLRFNYAIPLDTVEGDELEEFRVTVDTRF